MEKTTLDEAANLKELLGLLIAGLSATVLGAGRSHMKVRDRLQNAEVRLELVEDRTIKLEETTTSTHDSVIRQEMGILGLEDDMKNSIRRQEKILKTIGSIERLFKLNGNGNGDGDGS